MSSCCLRLLRTGPRHPALHVKTAQLKLEPLEKSNSEGELCQPEVPELGWTPLATTDSPATWVVHGNLNRFASFATSAEGIEDESL